MYYTTHPCLSCPFSYFSCISPSIIELLPILSSQWLSLKFPQAAIYVTTVRECYEAYVLYNFLCYLLNFLRSEYNLEGELNSRPPIKQPIPVCCCPPWPKGMYVHLFPETVF